GSFWIGTWGNGLHRLSAHGSEAWTSREGLPDDFVRTLYEDGPGCLWIGTRAGGLSRWKDTPMVTFGAPEGLSGNFASTVVRGAGGELWLGTWRGGLYRLRSGRFESQPSPVPTLYLTVRALALDPQGQPWIGNWEGLNGLTGAKYRHFGDADSAYLHVSAIVFDRGGRLVAITGTGIGPAQTANLSITANNHIDTSAGATRVLFDGIPAPVVSAQSTQVVAIVPYGVSGKANSKITVEYNGQVSAPLTVPVTDVAPGIFTTQPLGKGSPLVVNVADGTQNSATNPAAKGSAITFFVTGEGLVTATGNTLPIDGRLAAAPLQAPVAPVVVSVNNQAATILYAGALPGSAGIMQVNARLDANAPSGALALVVQVGNKSSQTLNVSVK
ncbi:MAG TPA: two-component regulator propeller domain-containing protein, partial [Verrucomicrobiae bacterium]|nr:two-component regulator propeller domain-containing protein [Verrucomicrobiae bacterium]